MSEDIKSKKEIKRKEYNLIRKSNSSLLHDRIKINVELALKILLPKYHVKGKYIGIYCPFPFFRMVAVPRQCMINLVYHIQCI